MGQTSAELLEEVRSPSPSSTSGPTFFYFASSSSSCAFGVAFVSASAK